jgi:DNA-binding helix-hairpin-helix protein with protein kinase domain
VLFVVAVAAPTEGAATGAPFRLEVVWAAILGVPEPGALPGLPSIASVGAKPSPVCLRRRRARVLRKSAGLGLLAFGAILWLAMAAATRGASFAWCIGASVAALVIWPRATAADLEAKRRLDAARSEWQELTARWQQEASDAPYRQKRQELEGARQQLLDLPNERSRRMRRLAASVRDRQLYRFLDQHRLGDAKIKGIGDGRLATLYSYGVETAADVTRDAVLAVPGFGPSLTQSLLAWRRGVERRFRFDASRGVDPRDQQTVEAEMRALQQRLEQVLSLGAEQLRQASQLVEARRKALRPLIDRSVRRVAQAEADWATF